MRLFKIFILLFVVTALCLKAEEKPIFWIGGYGGLNINAHNANFKKLPEYDCCNEDEYGLNIGLGYSFGLLTEFSLTEKVDFRISLGYSDYSADLNNDHGFGYALDNNDSTVLTEANYLAETQISGLDMMFEADYKLFKGLSVFGGLQGTYFLTGTFNQVESIKSPDNVAYIDGTVERNNYTGEEIPDFSPLQVFLNMGLSYDLPVGHEKYLTPYFKYSFPITSVSSVDWNLNIFQFGLAFKYPIFPAKVLPVRYDTVYQRDTTEISQQDIKVEKVVYIKTDIAEEEIETDDYILQQTTLNEKYELRKPIPVKEVVEVNLSCNIEAFGVTETGELMEYPALIIEELEAEEKFPLLPHVFFKRNNSDLTKSKMKRIAKDGTSIFSYEVLEWNTMEIYSHLLNIIGYRMKEFPNAKITVTGCNSNTGVEENNLKLSTERAKSVKAYLVNNWKISPDRVKTKALNLPENPGNILIKDVQIENQRVDISSSDNRILRPVKLQRTIKTSNPPRVELKSSVESGQPLRKWILNIEQKGEKLRQFSGKEIPESIIWKIEEAPIPQYSEPVRIQMILEDGVSNVKTCETEIEIKQLTIKKKRVELKGDKRIDKLSLIVFGFDKAEIKEDHKQEILDLKKKIKPNSKVTIIGYTDRTGDRDYNKDLAKRRCEEVQKILQVNLDQLKIVAVGNKTLLYDNNTPEGRIYSRTVRIFIETPIDK